uniref:Neprilysin-2 n=1 Tax=Panagrellus redivivus TaxID=6233 RepID=A0A7E4V4W6_PANRE
MANRFSPFSPLPVAPHSSIMVGRTGVPVLSFPNIHECLCFCASSWHASSALPRPERESPFRRLQRAKTNMAHACGEYGRQSGPLNWFRRRAAGGCGQHPTSTSEFSCFPNLCPSDALTFLKLIMRLLEVKFTRNLWILIRAVMAPPLIVAACLIAVHFAEAAAGPYRAPVLKVTDSDKSPGFQKAAAILRRSINESADPCDDFFEFTCGRWIAENPIPDDLTSFGHFTELREKVLAEMKALYESPVPSSSRAINLVKQVHTACMDIDAINNRKSLDMLKAVVGFGYWPIIHDDKWSSGHFDITELLINIGVSRGVDVFTDIYVTQDQKNVSRRLLSFDQGGLGLGSTAREYYLNETKYAKQLAAYEAYMFAKIKLIATDARANKSDASLRAEVKEILDFEKKFAKILTPEENRRNFTEMYNVFNLSALRQMMPLIDWNKYFRGLMPFDMHDYLDSDPLIIVSEPAYFDRLSKLLTATDTRVITNYILWRYTASWSLQLDERFEDIQQDFLKEFIGRKTKSPRWKDCNSAAGGRLSYASGAMYVRAHFDKRDRAAALDMIEDLRATFREILLETTWMQEGTRKYALEKAAEMQSLIGYPDFILDDGELDAYYENLTLADGDSYSQIVQKTTQWAQHKAFRRLLEPVDRTEFGTSSAVVNAFYSSVKNGITFPAAILQSPFFDRDFPKVLNYGGMGAVIGHEITHGFDDQGSQFDKIGNLHNWWDATTQKHFLNRTQCIIQQYSEYELPGINLKVNGVLTQGENIADNGGIKEAYRAYRAYIKKLGHEEKRLPGFENYTNDQIFFMSYAKTWCGHAKPEALIRQVLTDPHAPVRYRVNGVVRNQPEFATAFKCPLGSNMNPKHRCSVW